MTMLQKLTTNEQEPPLSVVRIINDDNKSAKHVIVTAAIQSKQQLRGMMMLVIKQIKKILSSIKF